MVRAVAAYNFQGTDVDAGDTALLAYSLLNTTAPFDVVGSTGAVLVKRAELNYEMKRTYNVVMRVTDPGTPGSAQKGVAF